MQAGLHVICDKPLMHTTEQVEQLVRAARETDRVFAVTCNYSGYPMVWQVRAGAVGTVRKVVVEYHQGWLATAGGGKQGEWRTVSSSSALT